MAAAKKTEAATTAIQPEPKAGGISRYGDYGTVTGFEGTTKDDLKTPFIKVLQPMSPEITNNEVEGAKPGMFYNTATGQLIPMDQGFVAVPLGKKHHFVEWRPREQGGGFVGTHEPNSAAVLQAQKAAGKRTGKLTIPSADGKTQNELIESHDIFCLLLSDDGTTTTGECAIFAATSTKIGAVKDIWTKMYMVKPRQPLFTYRIKITGFKDPRTNKGVFFNVVAKAFPVDGDLKLSSIDPENEKDLLDSAYAMFQAFNAGDMKADYSKMDSTEAAGGGADDVPF
jgi:hypothetical protein